MARHVLDANLVRSPTRSALAAMGVWDSTLQMVGSVWTAHLERSHLVSLAPQAARAVLTSVPCTYRTRAASAVHAPLARSQMTHDTNAWYVKMASTAMAACASPVLLDLSQTTTRAAAICAWHLAPTSSVPTVFRAPAVEQAMSLSPIAQGVSPALPSALHTCPRQARRACSVVLAASRMLSGRRARAAFL